MIHTQPDTDSPVVSFVFLIVVLIVVIIVVGAPWLNAWLERKLLERRKEAVRKFCRERGFEPNEDDLEAVISRRRR